MVPFSSKGATLLGRNSTRRPIPAAASPFQSQLKSTSWILSPCQCAGTSYGCKVRVTGANVKKHPDPASCKTLNALTLFLMVSNLLKSYMRCATLWISAFVFCGQAWPTCPNRSGCIGIIVMWINNSFPNKTSFEMLGKLGFVCWRIKLYRNNHRENAFSRIQKHVTNTTTIKRVDASIKNRIREVN